MCDKDTITCYLAAFDQAHLSPDGSYWTWRHPVLPVSLLETFYYDIAAKYWPEGSDAIPLTHLIGGGASIGSDWFCWYRWSDGGRDKCGRPGRRVLLAAFIRAIDHSGHDVSGILESECVNSIVAQALNTCPVPAPPSLEIEWSTSVLGEPPLLRDDLYAQRQISLSGSTSLSTAASIAARLHQGWAISCAFHRNGTDDRAWIDVTPIPIEHVVGLAASLIGTVSDPASQAATTSVTNRGPIQRAATWPLKHALLMMGVVAVICAVVGYSIMALRTPATPTANTDSHDAEQIPENNDLASPDSTRPETDIRRRDE